MSNVIMVTSENLLDNLSKANQSKLDDLGRASGVAQELRGPLTTAELMLSEKSRGESHKLYCILERGGGRGEGEGELTGMIFAYVKIGTKNLWLFDEANGRAGLQVG